jgi:hypothetical protein
MVSRFFFLPRHDKEIRGQERKAVPEIQSQKGIQNDAKRLSRFQVSNTRLHNER